MADIHNSSNRTETEHNKWLRKCNGKAYCTICKSNFKLNNIPRHSKSKNHMRKLLNIGKVNLHLPDYISKCTEDKNLKKSLNRIKKKFSRLLIVKPQEFDILDANSIKNMYGIVLYDKLFELIRNNYFHITIQRICNDVYKTKYFINATTLSLHSFVRYEIVIGICDINDDCVSNDTLQQILKCLYGHNLLWENVVGLLALNNTCMSEQLRTIYPNHPTNIMNICFQKSCKLHHNADISDLFIALSVEKVLYETDRKCGYPILEFASNFEKINLSLLEIEWRQLYSYFDESEKAKYKRLHCDKMWKEICSKKNTNNDYEFPTLRQVLQIIFCFPQCTGC